MSGLELSDSLTARPKVKLLTVRQLACHLNTLEKQHYAIELGGIGIDVGEVTLETPSGHIFDVQQPPRNSHDIEPHTVAS